MTIDEMLNHRSNRQTFVPIVHIYVSIDLQFRQYKLLSWFRFHRLE